MVAIECTSPATPTPRAARPYAHRTATGTRRVVRTEYLRGSAGEFAQRPELMDQIYSVYSEALHGTTRAELEALMCGSGELSLAVFYGADDEVAGFTYAHIELIECEGRTHAIFNAAVLCRLGYQAGPSGALFGLREALRFKLRHPRTPLAYFTRTCSPAAYRLIATTMPRVYPSRAHETPADVAALIECISVRREYAPAGGHGWVVRSPGTPHDASRLRRLERDPHACFYSQLNPRFAEGNSLLTWVPLDAANIIGGLCRLLRGRLAR
jgi:hypothetical protein